MHRRRFLVIVCCCLLLSCQMQAQYSKLYNSNIQTLRIEKDGKLCKFPLLQLHQDDQLNFSFDYLTHEYNRFTYKVEHCDCNWQVTSDLFESEYLVSAGNEDVIDEYQQSLNTSLQYTHYHLNIPNSDLKILLSGNYKLSIFSDEGDDGEPELIAETFFYVVDPLVSIKAQPTTNTDIDWNNKHQQLDVEVSTNNLQIRDASEEIKIIVLQNNRWDCAAYSPKPTAVTNNRLLWEHCRELIFPAGNEYRKFEMLSTHYPGYRIDKIRWIPPYYHVALYADVPRKNYIYDEDQNGLSVLRSENGYDPNTEAEYVMVHYDLESDYLDNCTVYIDGLWNTEGLTPKTEMTYNFERKAYEMSILQKMGYYNYKYIVVRNGISSHEDNILEGNFFQTENEYTILVYYQKKGERYDQLIGYSNFSYRPK